MGWGRRIAVLVGLVLAIGALPGTTSARPTGAEAVAACRAAVGEVPEIGERTCRTIEQFLRGFANGCRNLGLNPECYTLDGRRTGVGHMATYRASWTHRALTLQRGLGDNAALARQSIPHTHNSFNSSVYFPTLTNQDPNQIYSIRDQLDMDVRAIELDLHFVPSAYGKPKTGGRAVVLCHGSVFGRVHAGCSNDRPFADGLTELRQWLRQPQNRDEVVLLYLENKLVDGNGHRLAADAIEAGLGDLVARPPAGKPCATLPTSASPAQLRATGHRVIIVGNCGPGRWGTWVHERGPRANWIESSSDYGNDYPGINTGCAAERQRTNAGRAIVRWYEDSTWVSAIAGGGRGQVTVDETAAMARCGATLIGFDQLTPEDPRLAAAVWSWAVHEPRRGAPPCATSGADTRFHATDCAAAHNFVCMVNPDTWRVTGAAGPFANGAAGCAREFPGSTFAVPVNGWENTLVRGAAGNRTVWLNYSNWRTDL